jgi:hypothetical protein
MTSRALASETSGGRVVTFFNVEVVVSHALRGVNNKHWSYDLDLSWTTHKT